jgi:adenosylcobinamide-GDP ribazoletransferase
VLAQEFRAALAAISFLTRIPVGIDLDGDDVRRGAAYFPLVGAAIGASTGILSRRIGPQLALGAQTGLTGALHLDALADSADSLGSSDRERALEIMRDSAVGSFGTVAICLDLMIKAAALERCQHPVGAVTAAGALSRTVPVLLSASLPYARPSGTAQALSTTGPARALAAGAVGVSLAWAVNRDLGAIAVATGVGVASASFWRRKLGGVTGDTLGASIEVCEAAILLWSARSTPPAPPR